MSYDTMPNDIPGLRLALDNERERTRAAQAEREANWAALDRLRSRLRALVPAVAEGGDLVAALEERLDAALARELEAVRSMERTGFELRAAEATAERLRGLLLEKEGGTR